MVRVLVSESESLQCMIIKTQIHQCSPPLDAKSNIQE